MGMRKNKWRIGAGEALFLFVLVVVSVVMSPAAIWIYLLAK